MITFSTTVIKLGYDITKIGSVSYCLFTV